ncbi:hypothetical protein [Micromonospora sp. HUAS LYJ1]|uniref:hypothetical protein n=1 Tax=Micromonospora sp. HUAS LYJ1 TaxID=3061626 RepID=UPI00267198CC|nr:hypothetical protein [Micromonospora sp. HUAS LYJ1]WKU07074.1 hypothetical protein Q2K16_08500 [Micromonospora sp. HUAS LYJ1]
MTKARTAAGWQRPTRALIFALILAVTVPTACTPIRTSTPSADVTVQPSASPTPTNEPQTAQDRLRLLADAITPVTADAEPDPHTYLHIQSWSRATTVVSRWDIRRWSQPDGAGRVIERRLPDRGNLTRLPDGSDRDALAAAPVVSDETYARGSLARPGSEPIPSDRAGLQQHLGTISPPENGPDSIITAVVSLNNEHYLGHRQRQTILLILADLPGITTTTATDIAGRTGTAVSLNHDGSTKRLIIHPTSGELLAFQETFNTCRPARSKPCPRPGLFDYRLYLERNHTTPPDAPPTTQR